ncbi:MAG: YggS family pyridoxal phosphate-dependent enzyme, partial [Hyphomicrobium sp.]
MTDSVEALRDIRSRIELAAKGAGRDPQTVTLVAVSKTYGEEAIVPVIDNGQRAFGENRVQEAKAKWPNLQARFQGLELHLIGPLQSNKTAEAVELFDAIHTVDRPKIAKAIADEMAKQGKRPKLFVQVNT